MPPRTQSCVGHASRYAGQAADVANKAKECQFEALHKIYFYDAWRGQPELGTKGFSLHLPPRPGLLEAGCYWRQTHAADAASANTPNPKGAEGVLAEISLTDEDSEDKAGSTQPSLIPSPESTDQELDAPIFVSSADEQQASSPTEETEQSHADSKVVSVALESEEEPAEEEEEEEAEDEETVEEEEEEEEDMGEDVIPVEPDPVALAESEAVTKEASASIDKVSAGDDPAPGTPHVHHEIREGKASMSRTGPASPVGSPAHNSDQPSSSKAWEGGCRSNRPSDALVPDPSRALPAVVRGRRRWKHLFLCCGGLRVAFLCFYGLFFLSMLLPLILRKS